MACARGCCDTPADHFRSIGTAHRVAPEVNARDKILSEDMAAYKRLRKGGQVVAKMHGARNLERAAEIPQELKLGMILPQNVKNAIKRGDGGEHLQ